MVDIDRARRLLQDALGQLDLDPPHLGNATNQAAKALAAMGCPVVPAEKDCWGYLAEALQRRDTEAK